jgi:hypothetical protein
MAQQLQPEDDYELAGRALALFEFPLTTEVIA